MTDQPQIIRTRHEIKRRRLTVTRVERLAAQMARVVLSGDELQDFISLGFDDHMKLFFPAADAGEPAMRDFTPRHFDARKRELWIDFFLHDAGPATMWASQAEPGQVLEVGGPRGSAVLSPVGIDGYVLIGDETALPAIGRRLAELPASAPVLVVLEVDAGTSWPPLSGPAAMQVVQVARGPDTDSPGSALIEALRGLEFPAGNCFVWVAVESRAARAIRTNLRTERGIDKRWIKAAGYWQRGAVGKHDSIADEE